MEEVISSFLHLLHDTESFIRNSGDKFEGEELALFLRDFRCKRVNPLHRRMKRLDESRYVLSMVGLTNVGKSTLAHALLGHPVAPRLNGPATAVPVEYEYADGWMIKNFSPSNQQVITRNFDSGEELCRVLEKRVLGQEEGSSSDDATVERIVVYGPMEMLKDGIVFADTPGFGAAQFGVSGESQEEALVDYLNREVHEVMFCLSGANSMVSRSEVQFFQKIQELCSTVIVTKWDSETSEGSREIARYRDKFADLFPYCGFMFVEAKWAIEGKERQSIDALQSLIRDRATPENRREAIRSQLVSAWKDLQELGKNPLKKSKATVMPWHRAALPRFLAQARKESLNLTPAL